MKEGSIGGYSDCLPLLGRESEIVVEGHKPKTSAGREGDPVNGRNAAPLNEDLGHVPPVEREMEKGQPGPMIQFGFEFEVNLGLHWLRLIESGDEHAIAVRDHMLRQCSDFTRETLCSAFVSTGKAEIIRAHQLGKIVLRNRNHRALRSLFKRLSSKAYF